jgi:hypothetical protein
MGADERTGLSLMTAIDVLSIFAAAITLVLGVVAIILSIVFYRFASQQAETIRSSAEQISASVSRLEKLFDSLYSDTFTMMKDTVADMRVQLWRQPSEGEEADATDELADDQIQRVKAEVLNEISAVSTRLGITDARMSELQREIAPLLERVVDETRTADTHARRRILEADFREVYRSRQRRGRPRTFGALLENLVARGYDDGEVASLLFDMRRNDLVEWDGSGNALTTNDEIRLRAGAPTEVTSGPPPE